jgi:hypothetical protein
MFPYTPQTSRNRDESLGLEENPTEHTHMQKCAETRFSMFPPTGSEPLRTQPQGRFQIDPLHSLKVWEARREAVKQERTYEMRKHTETRFSTLSPPISEPPGTKYRERRGMASLHSPKVWKARREASDGERTHKTGRLAIAQNAKMCRNTFFDPLTSEVTWLMFCNKFFNYIHNHLQNKL